MKKNESKKREEESRPFLRQLFIDELKNAEREIKHALRKRSRKERTTKTLFRQSRRWAYVEREAILDYLHGDISEGEVAAAAYYELARDSTSFRYAATQFKRGKEDLICAPRSVAKDTPDDFDYLIMQWPWRAIWTCPQFPKMPWSKVGLEEKRWIQSHFPSRYDLRGFNTLSADRLDAMKVIEQLKKLAQETREKLDALRATEQRKSLCETTNESVLRNLASVRNDQTPWVEHIVCTLDYRSGKEALVKAFETWLKENRAEFLRDYYIPPIVKGSEHSPIRFHEMLKSLTAARLYVTLGCKNAKESTRKNRRQRADALRLRPFFREKPGKQLNTKALYRDRREWERAVAHAKSLLTADFDAY